MKRGFIYNIQHYSVHDGPGIRTTVFFKGCPLRCPWCHNPESQSFEKEHIRNEKKCIRCSRCLEACDFGRDAEKCTGCFRCAEACPSNAIMETGTYYDHRELMKEILKDRDFFQESSGGVTFSGGEPLFQADFLEDIMKACKEQEIHVTLDTCGIGPKNSLERLLPYCDLILLDMKNMEPSEHFEQTGALLEDVLNSLRTIQTMKKRFWIRIPVIPSYNDALEGYRKMAAVVGGAEKICFPHRRNYF